ncbi:MarR family transcriptional regulator [Streptomyces soliscabiei]|uniref:MarR family transcriptional regulator n=1 Tax=Streptomyces soliscabiei TaxID=588897 RepID=UPI0029A2353F|nr:MarR family transcriptional regulator [Streptomyces sp. NY05-11A]MDX2680100.1 MarR family transcriptional regulator [Streptomyces sp. NY05-11A]
MCSEPAADQPTATILTTGYASHITERTAQSIVTDLEQAGYVRRERDGRRTRYTVCLDGTLRHPAEAHVSVRDLLELFSSHDSGTRPETGARLM